MQKLVKWRRPAPFEMIQFDDDTGVLVNATFRPVNGVEIVGNGSLQAPLTVECEPGYRIEAGDSDRLRAINAELVTALEVVAPYLKILSNDGYITASDLTAVRAAIARAKE